MRFVVGLDRRSWLLAHRRRPLGDNIIPRAQPDIQRAADVLIVMITLHLNGEVGGIPLGRFGDRLSDALINRKQPLFLFFSTETPVGMVDVADTGGCRAFLLRLACLSELDKCINQIRKGAEHSRTPTVSAHVRSLRAGRVRRRHRSSAFNVLPATATRAGRDQRPLARAHA